MNYENINSRIDPLASIGERAVLINSEIDANCMVGRFSKIAYSQFREYSYISDYSICLSTSIGRYSAISWGVSLGPEEHDYTRIACHSFLYSTKTFRLVEEKHYTPFAEKCEIGSDVWIGCNSTILRGVTIGDGAVIGANSLVNKDVPPYAIFAGNPARLLKYRFDKIIIDMLLQLKWWNWNSVKVKQYAKYLAMGPSVELLQDLLRK